MSGPFISDNGDVISSSLEHSQGYAHAKEDLRNATALLPGQIQAIYTVDNKQNLPNGKATTTTYDVLITHPDGASEVIRRCQMLQPMFGGGINNFMECLPNDPGPKAKTPMVAPALKRGSVVLVGFISGQRLRPVILGCLPHPSPVAVSARPKKSKGSHLEWEFQGVNFQINNDGEYIITWNGPKTDEGKPSDSSLGPTIITLDKKGNVLIENKEKQSFELSSEEKTITITNDESFIKMDQSENSVTIDCKNTIINTSKDTKITVKGKADIIVTDDLTLSSESKINLQKGKGSSKEPFVLGKKFASHYKKLLNAISQIQVIGGPPGSPTSPPLNIADFISLVSDVDGLLSELITGD